MKSLTLRLNELQLMLLLTFSVFDDQTKSKTIEWFFIQIEYGVMIMILDKLIQNVLYNHIYIDGQTNQSN